MFELPTGPICAATVAHRPDTRTDGIGKQEIAPRHDIDARKKPSKRSQHWHELGYENDFAAMSQKQILSEFDPTFGKPIMRPTIAAPAATMMTAPMLRSCLVPASIAAPKSAVSPGTGKPRHSRATIVATAIRPYSWMRCAMRCTD